VPSRRQRGDFKAAVQDMGFRRSVDKRSIARFDDCCGSVSGIKQFSHRPPDNFRSAPAEHGLRCRIESRSETGFRIVLITASSAEIESVRPQARFALCQFTVVRTATVSCHSAMARSALKAIRTGLRTVR